MRHRIFSALTWKLAVAGGIAALGAGTTVGLVTAPISNSGPPDLEVQVDVDDDGDERKASAADDGDGQEVSDDAHERNAARKAAKAAAADDDDDSPSTAAHEDHDNFGSWVSEQAHEDDGTPGVDGQEISDAAHAKNEARKAAHESGNPHDDD